MDKKKKIHNSHLSSPAHFPPVIAVVGHVDHGKTTLLDAIRKTNIADREHGGITQRIGASRVYIDHEGKTRSITFIDTPGHEVFTKMRSRGMQAADIGILVVSVADGVKPQTRESIQLLQTAHIPYIVVLTKSDLPDTNPEKVKQQLLKEAVMLEGYGGDIPVIAVSAKTGYNLKELLDLIILVHDLHPHEDAPHETLAAIVIESRIDPKAGPKATIVVKKGRIALRDAIYTQHAKGKVRSIFNDRGEGVKEATKGEAVEVLGFETVPEVGSIVTTQQEEVLLSQKPLKEEEKKQDQNIWDFLQPEKEERILSLILVTDTQGSLEAILASLQKDVHVILQKTGEVTEGDVSLAKATGAIILSFNTKLRPDVVRFARNEKVLMKNYTIVYEMLDEIAEVVAGKQLALEEKILGRAKILTSFPFEKTTVLGVSVLEGRIARGDKVRLMRAETAIGESTIVSLRQGKQQTSKVEAKNEAGVLLSPFLDFRTGDMILCYSS